MLCGECRVNMLCIIIIFIYLCLFKNLIVKHAVFLHAVF